MGESPRGACCSGQSADIFLRPSQASADVAVNQLRLCARHGGATGLSALTLHAPRWCLETVGGSMGVWVGMSTVTLQDTEGTWGGQRQCEFEPCSVWEWAQGTKGCCGERAQESDGVTGPQSSAWLQTHRFSLSSIRRAFLESTSDSCRLPAVLVSSVLVD